MNCPKGCGLEVIIKYHEATHEKLIYNIGGEVLHRCNGKEYYCKDCKRRFPESIPCFHRKLGWKGYTKRGLDHHF